MFTRHLFAAAAMMAATLSAQADTISTSQDAAGNLAANMSIVDAGSSVSGTGLSGYLAATDSSQFALVQGVEGLVMLAARFKLPADSVNGDTPVSAPTDIGITVPPGSADDIGGVTDPVDAGGILPSLDATEVPEPSSIALLLAGFAGAAGFTRRKQG